MHIKTIFKNDLNRPINGVIKADEQDETVIFQELDEFVVTKEVKKHLDRFFKTFVDVTDNPQDLVIMSRIAVWVSGFFGSGKSHFLKILSYLLGNRKVKDPETGEMWLALEFFEEKLGDALLLGELRRAVQNDIDVILFNIDSKSDNKDSKDAILAVFLRVFNEMQGFSGDAPHIAQMERYLQDKGVLEKFHDEFQKTSGSEWVKERDAYLFMRDDVISALANTLGMSTESASKWFDEGEERFKLNIDGFANLVKGYLDNKGPNHRIAFLIDEVGQFIGNDTSRMLNLQTVVEDIGRICNGRAWVIVTSQEDIDAVVLESTRKPF